MHYPKLPGSRAILYSLVLCTLSGAAYAGGVRVPTDQPTIQQAIDLAATGDVILVSPGTYFENIDFRGKAITLRSVGGPLQTMIDGSNAGPVVTFQTNETAQSVLTGFTIQHGDATCGAGIVVRGASPTITRNVFRENTQEAGGYGAAIAGDGASPVIEFNSFQANSCDSQFLAGVVSFVNNSSPVIINNIFQNNGCRAIDMTLPVGNNPVVANNTIVQNSGGIRIAAGAPTSTQFYANNVLVANGIGLEVDDLVPGNEPTWINNLLFSNRPNYSGIADQTGVNGNLSANPQFISKRNLQLRPTAPGIDAGTLLVPNLPITDFLGNPRMIDGNGDGSALPDIGAYEFMP